jgi:putative FmdB family regulatory protein
VPTYQYACSDCGHDFEAFQSFSDDALTECPACHGRLRKVFNSVGIVFKGSGFYRNDSREKSGSKATGDAPKGESGSSSKKDSAATKSDGAATSSSSSGSSSSGSSSSGSSTSTTAGSAA